MLSQVLFGEKYRIIDEAGHWIKVETLFDNYSGWIDINHLQNTEDTLNLTGYVVNRSMLCYKSDNTKLVLEAGCEIYNPDFENKRFSTGNNVYSGTPDFSKSYITTTDSFADTAMKFINSPYIWGGRIPSGIDCSGLTQLVYKLHGIKIPRDSCKQIEVGEDIGFLEESAPGDLVFFDDDRGRITHVGMIISGGLVIHASGRVRIDSIDHQDLQNED
jgi:cell wall-associated NlpC family hydrolase